MTLRGEQLLPFFGLAYAIWTIASAPQWTVDDAYILFRYAENWVATGIPAWNPGQPPVEGYTGTLYLALLAAAHAIGFPLEPTAKEIGIFAYTLTGFLVWLILRQLGIRPLVQGLACLLYFSAAFLFPHALSGLETTVFVALLTLAVYLSLRAVDCQRLHTSIVTYLAFALLAIARPEGMLFAIALLCGLLLTPQRADSMLHQLRRLGIRIALFFGFPVAAVTLWRWSVYGDLLPNTYFAKVSVFGFSAGLSFLEFALQYWAALAVLVLVVAVPEWEQWTEALRRRYQRFTPILIALGVAALITLAEYSRSTLQMNYAHRFWAMLYPVGLSLTAFGVEQGLRTLETTALQRPLRFRRIQQIGLGLVVLQLLVHIGLWRWQERKFLQDYQQLLQEEHARAAQLLQQLVPPGVWIVVYPDAGLIPYQTKLPTIDGGRLNDRFLARHQWRGVPGDSIILNYIFAHTPAAFVFKSGRDDRLLLNAEATAIVSDPRFDPYVLVASFRTQARRFAGRYFLLLYLHRSLVPSMATTPSTSPVTTSGEGGKDVQP